MKVDEAAKNEAREVWIDRAYAAVKSGCVLTADEQRGWNKATDYIIDLLKKHCEY